MNTMGAFNKDEQQAVNVKWSDTPAGQEVATRLTEEFGYALTDLEQTVETLWGRLHSVTVPGAFATASSVAAEVVPGPLPEVSPLRDQLHRAHAVTASLYRLLDRLEV